MNPNGQTIHTLALLFALMLALPCIVQAQSTHSQNGVEGKWQSTSAQGGGPSILISIDAEGRHAVCLADIPVGQEVLARQMVFDQVEESGKNIRFREQLPATDQYKIYINYDLNLSEDGKTLTGEGRPSVEYAGTGSAASSQAIKGMNAQFAKQPVTLTYVRRPLDRPAETNLPPVQNSPPAAANETGKTDVPNGGQSNTNSPSNNDLP